MDFKLISIGLVFCDGKVLVSRRSKHDQFERMWEFPGGKVEKGELPHDAIVRELHEEVGLSVRDHKVSPLTFTFHDYKTHRVLLLFFRVEITDLREAFAKSEVSELRWVSLDELSQLEMPAGNFEIMKILQGESFKW